RRRRKPIALPPRQAKHRRGVGTGRREGRPRRRRAQIHRAGVGPQRARMARRMGFQLPGAQRAGPHPAARENRAHHQGRAGQGEDLEHASQDRPRPAAGLLMRSAPVQHRGVALILVLTTIAILTAIGVDFSYSSRVSLKLAENLRDETRAYYMARSAINLSRLLLHFQKQVDQLGGQLTQGLTQMLSGGKTPAPKT